MKKTNYSLTAITILMLGLCACGGNKKSEKEKDGATNESEIVLGDGEVKIAGRVWMSKNLDIDKFSNGETIPEAKTNEEWVKAAKNKQPAWCYYNNDSANGKKYGRLYNWYAVKDPRGLAPKGWRLPLKEDWGYLEVAYTNGETVRNSGKEFKSKEGWGANGNGNNYSGFNALPGGARQADGVFINRDYLGTWWSKDSARESAAFMFLISANIHYQQAEFSIEEMSCGKSVRCIKE